MSNIIEYNHFVEELEKTVYKNAKSDLINKVAEKPDRYIGIFRPTTPELKLIQNITQSHEISFGDFIEDIMTEYLGKYYTNLPKRAMYQEEEILFDQLFEYNGSIFMVEQKMRDDHDSTKKRGQFENFIKKIDYLKEKYPNKKINAGMWFVDNSLRKNRRYYARKMNETVKENVDMYLFYGSEFTDYLDKVKIWDELEAYLMNWKMSQDNVIELNFEKDWEDTKKELIDNVPTKNWKKIIKNDKVKEEVMSILFPTGKYKEILDELKIKY